MQLRHRQTRLADSRTIQERNQAAEDALLSLQHNLDIYYGRLYWLDVFYENNDSYVEKLKAADELLGQYHLWQTSINRNTLRLIQDKVTLSITETLIETVGINLLKSFSVPGFHPSEIITARNEIKSRIAHGVSIGGEA